MRMNDLDLVNDFEDEKRLNPVVVFFSPAPGQ